MPTFQRAGAPWAIQRACVFLLLGGCTAYQPVLELWPASDASAARNPPVGADDASTSPVMTGGDASGGPTPTPGDDASVTPGMDTADTGSAGDADGGTGVTRVDASVPVSSDSGTVGRACLSVTVTTVANNGGYSPHNVGAIWVAQSSGAFVKTLAVWARARMSHLTLWNSATAAAGLRQNAVDAVTSATLSSHQTHRVSWNCGDAKGSVAPDGNYRVYFEMTDDNVTGPSMFVDFVKGRTPVSLTPANAAHFTGISVVYTP